MRGRLAFSVVEYQSRRCGLGPKLKTISKKPDADCADGTRINAELSCVVIVTSAEFGVWLGSKKKSSKSIFMKPVRSSIPIYPSALIRVSSAQSASGFQIRRY